MRENFPTRNLFKWILLVILSVVLILSLIFVLPPGIDWKQTYRPAAQAVLHLRSPYGLPEIENAPFVAAPWGLIPLLPFALFPEKVGSALLFLINISAFTYTTIKLGAKPLAVAAILLSPPVLHNFLHTNIEWIPILGFALPPSLGLFFITVKPQTGFAMAFFWLYEALSTGGWRRVVQVFWPITVATVVSFLIFGFWPLQSIKAVKIAESYNASFWPFSIPFGLALIAFAIWQRKGNFAMAASPCLSPYVLFHTWSSTLIALSSLTLELIITVLALWLVIFLRFFSIIG